VKLDSQFQNKKKLLLSLQESMDDPGDHFDVTARVTVIILNPTLNACETVSKGDNSHIKKTTEGLHKTHIPSSTAICMLSILHKS
jgi:hypothetical protein